MRWNPINQRKLRHTFSFESSDADDDLDDAELTPLTTYRRLTADPNRAPQRRPRSLDAMPVAAAAAASPMPPIYATAHQQWPKQALREASVSAAPRSAVPVAAPEPPRRPKPPPIVLVRDDSLRGSFSRLLSPVFGGGADRGDATPRTPLATSLGVAQWVQLAPPMLPEDVEEAELEQLSVANTRIQPLGPAEKFASSEVKYLALLAQPGLFLVCAFRGAYSESRWDGTDPDCASDLPWWAMGAGFIGCLTLFVFCAFATNRVAFDERAYTCICCLAPYTLLLGGGWYAVLRSEPACGRELFYAVYVFGIAYVAYFFLLLVSLGAFYLYCRRSSGPFRGVPLYFIVVFAPLHILMPGVPVMPLAYLRRGPGRRRRGSSDLEAGEEAGDACVLNPDLVDAEACEVEMLTPRSVVRVSESSPRQGRVRKARSGPLVRV